MVITMAKQDDILHSPQAEQLLKDKDKVLEMMRSPDTQRLMELLRRSGGADLQSAAQAAMKGDTARLMGLVQQVMATPEGAKAVQNINKNLPK